MKQISTKYCVRLLTLKLYFLHLYLIFIIYISNQLPDINYLDKFVFYTHNCSARVLIPLFDSVSKRLPSNSLEIHFFFQIINFLLIL